MRVSRKLILEQILGAAIHPRNVRSIEDRYGRTIAELQEIVLSTDQDEVVIPTEPSVAYVNSIQLLLENQLGEGFHSLKSIRVNVARLEELEYMLKQAQSDVEELRKHNALLRVKTCDTIKVDISQDKVRVCIDGSTVIYTEFNKAIINSDRNGHVIQSIL